SAFPKEIIFTLAVGGAGAILQNVIQDLSPAFLILPSGELLWGDQYEKIGDGPENLSTVAGVVDIVDGKRGNTVQTAAVARYILALNEFILATEGIENTKSPLLLEKDEEGRTVLEQLEEARNYLRLFQMGLTNFLVHVAQNEEDGGFYSTYTIGEDLKATKRAPQERSLMVQALAIRALMASAEHLGLPLYAWSARDAYHFMNKKMWDKDSQFYARGLSAS